MIGTSIGAIIAGMHLAGPARRLAAGFPAIRIERDPYWDGDIYPNTPIEIVFDDHPRGDSVVFAVRMRNVEGRELESVASVQPTEASLNLSSDPIHSLFSCAAYGD